MAKYIFLIAAGFICYLNAGDSPSHEVLRRNNHAIAPHRATAGDVRIDHAAPRAQILQAFHANTNDMLNRMSVYAQTISKAGFDCFAHVIQKRHCKDAQQQAHQVFENFRKREKLN